MDNIEALKNWEKKDFLKWYSTAGGESRQQEWQSPCPEQIFDYWWNKIQPLLNEIQTKQQKQ